MKISYPALAEEVRQDIEKYRPFLTDVICKESPGLRPTLNNAQWVLDGDVLTLCLKDEIAALLMRQKGIEKQMADVL